MNTKNNWKRILASFMAVLMVVTMLPASAFADEYTEPYDGMEVTLPLGSGQPADIEGFVWEAGFKSECLDLVEHSHTDDCYILDCDHKGDGEHPNDCYSTSTAYTKCTHASDSEHTGSVDVKSIVTLETMRQSPYFKVSVKDHPAKSVIQAEIDNLYENGYSDCSGHKVLGFIPMNCEGVVAVYYHIYDAKFCYTTAPGSEPDLCDHPQHTVVGGSCYRFKSILEGGCNGLSHEHSIDCQYEKYTLYADTNGNGLADNKETKYTVSYVVDGEVVESYTGLLSGEAYPSYAGETPTKAADAQYTYTFTGWDGTAGETVTGNVTHNAQFSTTINTYTVTWYDEDGTTELEKDPDVPYGTKVSFDGATPTKASDVEEGKVWKFAGWDPAVTDATVVTGDMSFKATFSDKEILTVKYNVEGASKTEYVVEDETAPAYAPTREYYTLNGWYTDAECTQAFDFNTAITAVTELYAKWTPVNDVNEDEIADEEQSCTINITVVEGEATVTVNGEEYTGTKSVPMGADVAIKVAPSENYYVDRVVNIPNPEPVRESGVCTYNFAAGIGQSYDITFVMGTPILAAKEGAVINKYDINNTEIITDEILTEAFTGKVVGELTYKAGELNLNTLNMGTYPIWLAIDSDVSVAGVKSYIENSLPVEIDLDSSIIKGLLALAGTDVDTLLAELTAGLHNFGDLDIEEVKVTFAGNEYYAAISATSTVEIEDLRTETTVAAQNFEFTYGETFSDEEIIALANVAVSAEGAEIDWDAADITVSKDFTGTVDVGTYNVIFKYKGNDEYKPSECTVEVTVNKADSYVNITEATVKYGTELNASALIDTGAAERVEFAAGVYMGDDVSADAGTIVYLNMPELIDTDILPELIRPTVESLLSGLTEGAEISISELNKYLTDILEGVEGLGNIPGLNIDSNTVSSLISALERIEDVEGIGDIKIKVSFGGTITLKDAGAYIVGAVVADANYNTSVGVNYAVITPDGYKADLGWNQEDENGVITGNALLNGFDFGASVVKVYEGTIEDAQKHLNTFFLGVDANGEFIVTDNSAELEIGAYTQVAFLADAGNTMYYAEPIVRVFVIAPQIDTVVVTDTEVVYDGEAHEADVNVLLADGSGMNPAGLTVTYVGVDTQGNTYTTTEAPVNTGVYAVFATYAVKEDGVYQSVGFDAGVLLIKPATAVLTVEDTTVSHDGTEKEPTIINENALELIKVIVDENNNVNIVFPEYFGIETETVNVAESVAELQAILNAANEGYVAAETVINKLAAELDKVDLDRIAAIGGEEAVAFIEGVKAEVVKAGETLAKYDVDTVAAELADVLEAIDVNTITVNGALPTEVGVYDVTVVGFGVNYMPAAAEGTLTIQHDVAAEWSKDATGHWHVCQVAGCEAKFDFAAHTPGAAATATTPQTCTVCGYEITPATGGGSVTPTPTPTPGVSGGSVAPVDPLKPFRDAADKAIDEAEAADADLYTAIADEIKAIGDEAHAKIKAAKTKEEIAAIEADAKAKIAELKLVCDVESSYIVARSKCMKAPSGKDSIRIKWYDQNGRVVKFEGVEIFRSTKRNEGYKKMYTSVTDQYYNTAIEPGVKYYYKVRGYVTINGEKVYTEWSKKAIRTAKEL